MNKIFLLFFISILSCPVFAHEYWLEPDNFFLLPKEKTSIRLFLGDALKKEEERTFQLSRTPYFTFFSLDTAIDLKKNISDGASPIHTFSAEKTGNYTFVMERNPVSNNLEAKKFEDYLREDGLDYIIEERKKLGESDKEGRERYSRFIKMMLQVGDKHDAVFNKQTGLGLRIYSTQNPYSKKPGDTLECWVMFGNKPVANKTVFADNRDGEKITTQKIQTDANGKFKVKLDRKGTWLIRLVIMQRCQEDCAETDWESFWGAYSFGVR